MSSSQKWEIQNKPLKNNLEWLRMRNETMMKDLKEQKELYSNLLKDYNWMRIKHQQEISNLKVEAKSQFNIFLDQIKEIQTQNGEKKPELVKEFLGKFDDSEERQGHSAITDVMAQWKKKTIENSLCDDERKQVQIWESLDDPRIKPIIIYYEKIQTTVEEQKSLNQEIEEHLLSEKQNDSRVPKSLQFEGFVETLKGLLCITQQNSKVHACKKSPIGKILVKVTCIIMLIICYVVVIRIMN